MSDVFWGGRGLSELVGLECVCVKRRRVMRAWFVCDVDYRSYYEKSWWVNGWVLLVFVLGEGLCLYVLCDVDNAIMRIAVG